MSEKANQQSEQQINHYKFCTDGAFPATYYKDEIARIQRIAENADNKMMDALIEYSKTAIRGAFILNGAAAVALLAFVAELLSNKPYLISYAYWSLFLLCCGALCAVISSGFSYLAQEAIQKRFSFQLSGILFQYFISYYDATLREEKEQYETMYPSGNFNEEKAGLIQSRLDKIDALTLEKKQALKNEDKFQKKQYRYTGLSIGLIVCSYVLFLSSIIFAGCTFL